MADHHRGWTEPRPEGAVWAAPEELVHCVAKAPRVAGCGGVILAHLEMVSICFVDEVGLQGGTYRD